MPNRSLHVDAQDPAAGSACLLTKSRVEQRRVRPDDFFKLAEYQPLDDGYRATLPASDASWSTVAAFLEEERECCPGLSFDTWEEDGRIVLRAT